MFLRKNYLSWHTDKINSINNLFTITIVNDDKDSDTLVELLKKKNIDVTNNGTLKVSIISHKDDSDCKDSDLVIVDGVEELIFSSREKDV